MRQAETNSRHEKGPFRKAVDALPLIEVAHQLNWLVKEKQQGSNYMPCPFCGNPDLPKEERSANFMINTGDYGEDSENEKHQNYARCWKCGVFFTNGVNLITKLENYDVAYHGALHLALLTNMISKEVFDRAWDKFNVKPDEVISPTWSSSPLDLVETQRTEMASLAERDAIYRCLSEVYCTAYPQYSVGKLSTEHYDYLRNQRYLSDAQIEAGGYFTFPPLELFPTLESLLATQSSVKTGAVLQQLLGIPGFFQFADTHEWSFKALSRNDAYSIGIPIRNASQQIQGIQVRLPDQLVDELGVYQKTKKKSLRYVWFSSKNQNHAPFQYGLSSGSPVDVCLPETSLSTLPILTITEGRFKAQCLADTFGCPSISVQGVNNIRGIETEIQSLIEMGYPIERIYLVYDADTSYKWSVYQAGKKLSRHLATHFPALSFFYTGWDVRYGKGIDDLIFANEGWRMSTLPCETFERICDKFWSSISRDEEETWTEEQRIEAYCQCVLPYFPSLTT